MTTATPRQTLWPTDRGLLTPERYYRIYGADRPERAEFMSDDQFLTQRITQIRHGVYVIPSQTFFRAGRHHITNYNEQRCSCPDFMNRNVQCKHLLLVNGIHDNDLVDKFPISEYAGILNFITEEQ